MSSGRKQTTVKVHRLDLLKQVEAAHVNAMADFQSREVEYERDLSEWKRNQLAYLYKAIDRVQGDDYDTDGRGRLEGYRRYDYGPEPPQNNYAIATAKDIALLEMSAEDIISVSTDSEWTKYL